MGAKQTTIGLKMMEAVYPSKQAQSVFQNPKLRMMLEKEVRKRGLTLDDLETDIEAIDGDMDTDIDRCIRKVFEVYDTKRTGALPRKVAEQFFKDCLQLYAMRQGRQSKDIVPKNVNMKQALGRAVQRMAPSGGAVVSFQDFEKFVNAYDIDEALQDFLGGNGLDIDMNVQFVDVSQFTSAQKQAPKLVYREYPDD